MVDMGLLNFTFDVWVECDRGVDEFLGKSWSHVPPGSTKPVGLSLLKARGISPEARWYCIGLGPSDFGSNVSKPKKPLDIFAVERTVVIELPRLFIQTLMYGVVAYAIIGLNGQLLSSSRTSSVPLPYGMTTDAVTPNHDIAAIISSAFDTIWNFFSGFHHSKNIWWTYRISSKFGDIQIKLDVNRTMEQFIWSYFRFRHDFVEYVAVTIVGIVVRRLHFFLSQSGHVTFRQDRT